MINATDVDQRMADHHTRIDCVNRDGWLRAATVPTWATRMPTISTATAAIWQRMGADNGRARASERLQGETVRHAVDPSAL